MKLILLKSHILFLFLGTSTPLALPVDLEFPLITNETLKNHNITNSKNVSWILSLI